MPAVVCSRERRYVGMEFAMDIAAMLPAEMLPCLAKCVPLLPTSKVQRYNSLRPSPADAKFKLCVVQFKVPGAKNGGSDKGPDGNRIDSIPIANGVIHAGGACDLLLYDAVSRAGISKTKPHALGHVIGAGAVTHLIACARVRALGRMRMTSSWPIQRHTTR